MSIDRVPPKIQAAFLKTAALALAKHVGESIVVSNICVTEVKLDTLYFWLTPFGPNTNLDVWDEAHGGNKVLNMCWGPDGKTEITSFRRGDWEAALLQAAANPSVPKASDTIH